MSGIAGTICVRNGRILVIKRAEGPWWDLPKERIEAESIRTAAVRETEEEIGLTPLLTGEVVSGRSPRGSTIWLFKAALPDGEINLLSGHTEFAWVTPEKAVSLLYPALGKIVMDDAT